jgi:hypothetical protein
MPLLVIGLVLARHLAKTKAVNEQNLRSQLPRCFDLQGCLVFRAHTWHHPNATSSHGC